MQGPGTNQVGPLFQKHVRMGEGMMRRHNTLGFGSVSREDRESRTLRSESAGDQFVLRMFSPPILYVEAELELETSCEL